ncbi:hypothetical protein [Chitinophaga ginsengisoli]|uniref:Uncharacterized protein n=1 Tax=Chitinophaga ginsengisoli TaxID=363837 RepID=A0A2P8G4P2_9BACT|nr:hypothetical protein [Chitinophaga ginsengisoli]PSL28950.1 hypothetical protein CLV42_10796 [Chitinophaga ginsengisoli]
MKSSVNYIRHLNDFYSSHESDRLHANHISLYHALFRIWNKHEFENPIQIRKEEVLRLCGIGSKTTYTKCLRDLHDLNYIIYRPSKTPFTPSAVTMLPLARNGTHNPDQNCSSTYTEISPHTDGNSASYNDPILGHYIIKQLNSNKTGSQTGDTAPKKIIPDIEEAIAFFVAAGQPRTEAIKFFYHNQAIGWLMGGNPILDWKAAANKWIENTPSINLVKNAKLSISTEQQSTNSATKDYSQPL